MWIAYKTETVENQSKGILPLNDISATLFYNQRLIISEPIPEPICWRLTKVTDVNPKGLRNLTFAQDVYNQFTDYIEKDLNGKVIGMYADYYLSKIEPTETITTDNSLFTSVTSKITMSGVSDQIKIGGSKTFTVTFYEDESVVDYSYDSTAWSFEIDGEDVSNLLTISYPALNKCKIRFNGGDNYIQKILTVTNVTDKITSIASIEIIAF